MDTRIRVLVVDDSGFAVAAVARKLQADPRIEVVGSARNGIEALEKVKELKPDVVTLDVIMPEMDGLAALERIMAEQPTPVVMLSALTSLDAETTIRALELGAVDFFLKSSIVNPAGNGSSGQSLVDRVKLAAGTGHPRAHSGNSRGTPAVGPARLGLSDPAGAPGVIVIGCSTGGPRALMEVVPAIPPDMAAALLIVQHMPPLFTSLFARRLAGMSRIPVGEAREGSPIQAGQALLAPGDYHMLATRGHRVSLTQDPPVLGVRPSVDVTMQSVAHVYGSASVGVVLTGMGSDGTVGSSHIKAAGGRIISEDESTCAIYGMPRSVARAGYADKVLPLDRIAAELADMCSR